MRLFPKEIITNFEDFCDTFRICTVKVTSPQNHSITEFKRIFDAYLFNIAYNFNVPLAVSDFTDMRKFRRIRTRRNGQLFPYKQELFAQISLEQIQPIIELLADNYICTDKMLIKNDYIEIAVQSQDRNRPTAFMRLDRDSFEVTEHNYHFITSKASQEYIVHLHICQHSLLQNLLKAMAMRESLIRAL